MKRYIAISLTVLTILMSGCTKSENSYSTETYVMNTYVTQRVYGKNAQKAAVNVNNILKSAEQKLSLYIDSSEVAQINKNAGVKAVNVSGFTYNLIEKAKDYSAFTNGTFDITIAPLTTLWGVTGENPHVPDKDEINKAIGLIDYSKIELNKSQSSVMLKEKGMAIDLGGIAKGYMMDLVREEYEKCGINSALVSLGGNIFAYGTKPDKTEFKIGIRDPLSQSPNDIMATLSIKDKAVSTTGAYERYFEQDGKIYHHVLDTKTGYPADSDLLSVTVISSDGALADFLSTALYIAGKSEINKYIQNDDFSVIIIDKENRVYISNSLKDNFSITNDKYVMV